MQQQKSNYTPPKYKVQTNQVNLIYENIQNNDWNYIIVGHPGIGKTETLKKIQCEHENIIYISYNSDKTSNLMT